MTDEDLDKRVNPYRDDLAAAHLKGKVQAKRFTEGTTRQVVDAAVQLREAPRHDAVLETELLLGEVVTVYDEHEGWAWVQAETDSHVGYLSANALGGSISQPTHRVRALRTHIYPEPDYKAPPLDLLSMNARIELVSTEGRFAQLRDGRFVVATHCAPIDSFEEDFVETAEKFLGTPYLWGGRTSIGLDCSAVVQLALQSTGAPCPRDSDMQETALGEPVSGPHDQGALRRGDLVFWDGHVGVMVDGAHLVHANVHHMAVEIEPAAEAIARIETAYGPITSVRRPS